VREPVAEVRDEILVLPDRVVPLRLYAAGIVAAGGRADVRRWAGVLHGFPGMTAELPEASESLQWAADRLRDLLRGDRHLPLATQPVEGRDRTRSPAGDQVLSRP
jgi:hypothetical protein